jgi:hypothetical protein
MRSRSVPFFTLLLSSWILVTPALAQSDRPAMEVAGHVALQQLNDSGTTTAGIGGRFGLELSRWVSLDAEVTFFPKDEFEIHPSADPPPPAQVSYARRRTDVLAGVKVGLRGDRFGLFGKVRPGFTHLTDRGIECIGAMCALMLFARPEYRTEFALDLGGIVEFYPTRRTVARVDFGDMMIRNRGTAAPPCADCTTHNFTSRFGFGLRF